MLLVSCDYRQKNVEGTEIFVDVYLPKILSVPWPQLLSFSPKNAKLSRGSRSEQSRYAASVRFVLPKIRDSIFKLTRCAADD